MFSNGVDAYVAAAKAAGVDGILTLDLPPEEAGEFSAACVKHGVDTVFIIAPTTPDARIAKIAAATSGFLYYASREGVTGVRDEVAANIPEALARIRARTKLPVAVGFGISTRAQVAQVAAQADGVVVGSALVNCMRDHLADRAKIAPALAAKAADIAGVQMHLHHALNCLVGPSGSGYDPKQMNPCSADGAGAIVDSDAAKKPALEAAAATARSGIAATDLAVAQKAASDTEVALK